MWCKMYFQESWEPTPTPGYDELGGEEGGGVYGNRVGATTHTYTNSGNPAKTPNIPHHTIDQGGGAPCGRGGEGNRSAGVNGGGNRVSDLSNNMVYHTVMTVPSGEYTVIGQALLGISLRGNKKQ